MEHTEYMAGITEAAERLTSCLHSWQCPEFFFQFGNGFCLDGFFDEPPQEIELRHLPGMPEHLTPDQMQPVFYYGSCNGVLTLVTSGHRHLYEGLGLYPCLLPLMTAWKLGIRRHVFIEDAISLQPDIKSGCWTLLTDYINGYHFSPLDGLQTILPEAFPDMGEALSQHQNSGFMNAFGEIGLSPRHCVFMSRPGSQFCTMAEAAYARHAGVDLIGHGLVMEIITSHALGCCVSAFALACGQVLDGAPPALKRADILDTCRFSSSQFIRGVRASVHEMVPLDHVEPMTSHPIGNADELLTADFRRLPPKPRPYKLIYKN